jgi:hypothetical protein
MITWIKIAIIIKIEGYAKKRGYYKPFELYVSDPREAPEAEAITKIIFPSK